MKKKERLIQEKAEVERLMAIFTEVPDKKLKTVKGLIAEAAFMVVTLKELKEIIQKDGVLDQMEQGSYSILREHPALKSYNAIVQRYTTVTEKLVALLPKDEEVDGYISEFNDFLAKRQ